MKELEEGCRAIITAHKYEPSYIGMVVEVGKFLGKVVIHDDQGNVIVLVDNDNWEISEEVPFFNEETKQRVGKLNCYSAKRLMRIDGDDDLFKEQETTKSKDKDLVEET